MSDSAISSQAKHLWRLIREGPKQIELPLPQKREMGERAEDFTVEPEGVRYEAAQDVGGLWAVPENARDGAAVLYLFGGGYVISSPHSRRKTAGHLARAAGARALVPNYRLAPEHPFPAAVDDAAAAYRWLLKQGARPEQTVVAGDSSGGGLTVATLLRIRATTLPMPAGGVPISPWADLTCSGASFATRASADICVTREGLLAMAADYLHGVDARDPEASPAFADVTGLPPLFVLVGGDEVLLDDAIDLARNGGVAGSGATLYVGAGMQHVFPIYAGAMPEADAAIAAIGAWVSARTAG